MKDQIAVVASSRPVAADIAEIELRPESEIEPLPGQFAHIGIQGVFLRRPISVAGYKDGLMRILVQRVGRGSRALSELKRGETVKILAPLGNPFPLEPALEGGGKIWIAGGGIGVAPLLFLAENLSDAGASPGEIRSFIGFRNDSLVFGASELERFGKTELSTGGFVTDLLLSALEYERPSVIYACGPTGLLRALQKICGELDLTAYASLEEHMGCGLGACLVCNCKVRTQKGDEYKRVCHDGPVFRLSEVIFE